MKASAAIVVIGLLLLPFSACGGNSGGTSPSPATTQSPPAIPTPRACPTGAGGMQTGLFLGVGRQEFGLGEPIRFTLTIANCGDGPVVRFYPNAQRYDITISTSNGDEVGDEVWRWSADKVFAEVLGEETFDPGEIATYSEVWNQVDNSGRQLSEGRYHVLAIDVGCEDEALSRCHFGPGVYFEITP